MTVMSEERWARRDAPLPTLVFATSVRGLGQANPHILGDEDAGAIGHHATIGNPEHELAASDQAHGDLVAYASRLRCDGSRQRHLADADRASFARGARPSQPIADHLPH